LSKPAQKVKDEVNCLYCGKRIADDATHCPSCGAVSHYRKKGYGRAAIVKFLVFFSSLVLVCILLIFWLPR
jgi:predicted nucleic acid-binding Zn ribbon protein